MTRRRRDDPQLDYQALVAAAATDMTMFVELVMTTLRPDSPVHPNWHIEAIAQALDQLATSPSGRLMITLPPAPLRAAMTSVAFAAWLLGHDPATRIACVSQSDVAARALSSQIRTVLASAWYRAAFPGLRLTKDTDREVTTTRQGGLVARSINGALPDAGCSTLVIDTPMTALDAASPPRRERLLARFRSDLIGNFGEANGGRVLLVAPRLHIDDLPGFILVKATNWRHLDLPAIARKAQKFDLGGGRSYARQPNEVLEPLREPHARLTEIERQIGEAAFRAQYLQSPVPPEGRTVALHDVIEITDLIKPRASDEVVISWHVMHDISGAVRSATGMVLLLREPFVFVHDVIQDFFRLDELKQTIDDVARRYRKPMVVIEAGKLKAPLIRDLVKGGLKVGSTRSQTPQKWRLFDHRQRFHDHEVILPADASWTEALRNALVSAPGGHNPELAWALANGLTWNEENKNPVRSMTNRQLAAAYKRVLKDG